MSELLAPLPGEVVGVVGVLGVVGVVGTDGVLGVDGVAGVLGVVGVAGVVGVGVTVDPDEVLVALGVSEPESQADNRTSTSAQAETGSNFMRPIVATCFERPYPPRSDRRVSPAVAGLSAFVLHTLARKFSGTS